MTLEGIALFLRRWLWLFLLAGFLAAATSYAVSARLPKVYEARAKLELLPGDATARAADASQIQGLTSLARTYAEVVKTRPVLEAAISDGSLALTYDQLSRLVSVTQLTNTQLLQIAARGSNPQEAANTAALVSNAFMRQVRELQARRFSDTEQNLRTELDQTKSDLAQRLSAIDQLRSQPASPQRDSELAQAQVDVTQLQLTYQNAARALSDFRLAQARAQDVFSVVEPAAAAPDPVEPRVLVNVALAAFVGLLTALGIASLSERLDDRLVSPERLAQRTNLQVLAGIATLPGRGSKQQRELPSLSLPGQKTTQVNAAAEGFRLLVTNLRFLARDALLRTLLVTSSKSGDGKTTTAANLAIAAAQSGDSVILIDADLRRPALHQLFDLHNEEGLTTLLLNEDLSAARMLTNTQVGGLRVLTSGPVPQNPGSLLASRQMSARVAELAALADFVIFDAPPLLAVSDAAHLAGQMDGVVLVVDAKRTRQVDVTEATSMLHNVQANLLGAVLNWLPAESSTFYGYYGYTQADNSESTQPATPPAVALDGRTAAATRLDRGRRESV
ncbi:MAG: polysaccharide biosynthesis tyrosine autokinase [Chloroflexota bacterium]